MKLTTHCFCVLLQDSDEDYPLRTSEMVRRPEALNISSERRTLARDIATLNAQGYEILSTSVNRETAFYTVDRAFCVPEIKILIDAVQAAN